MIAYSYVRSDVYPELHLFPITSFTISCPDRCRWVKFLIFRFVKKSVDGYEMLGPVDVHTEDPKFTVAHELCSYANPYWILLKLGALVIDPQLILKMEWNYISLNVAIHHILNYSIIDHVQLFWIFISNDEFSHYTDLHSSLKMKLNFASLRKAILTAAPLVVGHWLCVILMAW